MRTASALACLLILIPGLAAAEPAPGVYDFESGQGRGADQWRGGVASTLATDSLVVHGGRLAARIRRGEDSDEAFSAFSFNLPADRAGQGIELRGWLKSDDVVGWFGLWFRLDGEAGSVAFDNMHSRGLTGTSDWTEYRIVLPLPDTARTLVCGALLGGTGTIWADDFSLWIDGRPLAEAPPRPREVTVLDTDIEFVAGSGLDFAGTTPLQADNLALLGRVWGLLKYHHPAATSGARHWDFELFRVMPAVLAAGNGAQARTAMVAWIDGFGPIAPCAPCAEPPVDPAQAPDLAWITDTDLLGDELSARLVAAHAARPADGIQFWVQATPQVGNPDFNREPAYTGLTELDTGYRLLALFRFWNIVEHCCPNRGIIGEDWPGVLREFVPRLAAATMPEAWRLHMLALIARLNDTHTQLGGAMELRPPGMEAQLPVVMRWVEDRPVVAAYAHEWAGPASGLEIGDAFLAVDGQPVAELLEAWAPYYSASNEPQRHKQLAAALARGPAGSCRLTVLRDGAELDLGAERMELGKLDHTLGRFHALPGAGFRMLLPEVAYMALDRIKSDAVTGWIEEALAGGARGLIIDCRAYPGDFPIFTLGGHLVAEPTPFVTFTRLDLANPGAFLWQDYVPLMPKEPHFPGQVVVLVDETAQSSAEYHALAFRAAPGAVVMGSTTSGADGNVSRFALPGGLSTMISGIGVYDDERRNTQRAGIVPDVEVLPTIAGLRAGRDEVLEAAVAAILGREATAEERAAW